VNGSNFCAEWVRCYGGQDIGKERSKHVLVKPDLQYGTARGTLYFSSFTCCRAPFRHSSFSELIFGSLRKDLSLKEGQTITVSWHHFSWSKCAGCAASAGCTNVLRSLRTFEVNLPGKGGRQDALVFLCLPIKKKAVLAACVPAGGGCHKCHKLAMQEVRLWFHGCKCGRGQFQAQLGPQLDGCPRRRRLPLEPRCRLAVARFGLLGPPNNFGPSCEGYAPSCWSVFSAEFM
jgi:hypothetical protein